MSNTYYTSLTGMLAASYGLQNTSHNVANMQSSGFKRSDVFYSSLSDGSCYDSLGSGVCVGGRTTNFANGQNLNTGKPTDFAIDGNGFFIVKRSNGDLMYTRNGEFIFNSDGVLVDKHSQGVVQGYNTQGKLVPINQFNNTSHTGKATTSIELTGEWIIRELEASSPGTQDPDPLKSKYEPVKFSVAIFDAVGKEHLVELTFEAPHTPGTGVDFNDCLHWNLVAANCSDATISFDPQALEFENDMGSEGGAAKNGMNSIKLMVNNTQQVTLTVGDFIRDKESSVRIYKKDQLNHSETTIDIKKQDGYGLGQPIGFSFDDNGQITYHYNNGQSETGVYLALAMFDDVEHNLTPAQDNLFRAKNTQLARIKQANVDNFGRIEVEKLESSNVDSTTEFANIVVLQRMFQACSQIMDIDKQLLEELYRK